MVEYQDLETHLNRIEDFTGNWVRISNTTSCGRSSDDKFLSLDIDDDSKGIVWESETVKARE